MPPHPASLSLEERASEVARILAAGLLRLAENRASPADSGTDPTPKKPPEFSLNCLELARETRLNVHTSWPPRDHETPEENMDFNVVKEVAALQRLTVKQIRGRYAEVYGEETPARNKVWLLKRIAWRLQALAEGDLSERARRRTAELANDADLLSGPPQPQRPAEAPSEPERTRVLERVSVGSYLTGRAGRYRCKVAAGKL
jgi:Protein of unknown function (DUF2924)